MSEINTSIREIHIIGAKTREAIVAPDLCGAMRTHRMLLAGLSQTGDGFEFRRVAPAMLQILACLDGVGEALVDGAWQSCGAGQAYVTPPGVPHGYRAVPRGDWRLAWVIYEVGAHGFAPQILRPTLVSGDFRPLGQALELLHQESQGAGDAAILHNLAALAHGYALRCLQPLSRLASLWDSVRKDLGAPWTVSAMASIAAMSNEHLRRICLEEHGTSPLKYLTRLRMREAQALLASSSYKLAQVAERVGYDNVFAFSTAYKRCHGYPPSQTEGRVRSPRNT